MCHLLNYVARKLKNALRTPFTDFLKPITDQEVLKRMGMEWEFIKTIKVKKLKYLGHVIRKVNYDILKIIVEGQPIWENNVEKNTYILDWQFE